MRLRLIETLLIKYKIQLDWITRQYFFIVLEISEHQRFGKSQSHFNKIR